MPPPAGGHTTAMSVAPDAPEAGRAAMSALVAAPDVFEAFFDACPVGLALADLSTRYLRVNAAFAELVCAEPEDLIGVPFARLLAGAGGSTEPPRTSLLLAGQVGRLQTEQSYPLPDGSLRWVLHAVTVVPDAAGRPALFAVGAQDISQRHAAEQDLRRLTASLAEQAVRDPLTGLANRMLLEERLRAVLARDARTGRTTGLLFCDLDGFKPVNDAYGHLVGDAVLRAVAQRLVAAVRPSDTVARLGGDEFVVLVEEAEPAALHALAERLRVAVEEPIVLGARSVAVGVSIGVASSAAGADDPRTLLGRADRAMYTAKRSRPGPDAGRPG